MELFELQNAIMNNKIPNFLIFVGEEYAIKDIYIKKMSEVLKREITITDSLSSVLSNSRIISLVGSDKFYLDRYDNNIISNEKVWEGIDKKLKNNYLVLVFNTLDKRSKFYNTFKNRIVEFTKQTPKVLKGMISNIIKMNEENILDLMERCEYNYSKSLLEVDKIQRYSKIENITDDEAYLELVKSKVIIGEYPDELFPFISLVLQRKKNCYKAYQELKRNYESNIKILSLLYSNFKNQLVVETVKGATQETTGMNSYTIKVCQNRAGKYSIKELKNALNLIVEMEQGVKLGKIEESLTIDYLLVNIL